MWRDKPEPSTQIQSSGAESHSLFNLVMMASDENIPNRFLATIKAKFSEIRLSLSTIPIDKVFDPVLCTMKWEIEGDLILYQ